MKLLPAFALSALAILASPIIGAEPEKDGAPVFDATTFRTALTGNWQLEKRQISYWSSEIHTFRADGTFSSEALYDLGEGPRKLSLEGTWELNGNRLSRKTAKSSDLAAEPIGRETVDAILSATDKEFRYVSDNNPAVRIETRVDSAEPHEPPVTLGYSTQSTGFHQPTAILMQRLAGSILSEYADKLEAECVRFFSSAREPENINVTVAVKPGGQARIWLEPSEKARPEWAPLLKKLEAVTPCEVTNGPIGFVILGRLGGGVKVEDRQDLPLPPDWKTAMEGQEGLYAFDGMLKVVWPEKEAEKKPEEKKE